MTTQDGFQQRSIEVQDLIRHALVLCGAGVPQERAPRGNTARQLSDALPKVERGIRKGSEGKGADGTGKLSVVSQRLPKGWRDGRRSVSGPPRSKRESEQDCVFGEPKERSVFSNVTR